MENIVDVHCHILYGVDDGSKDLEMSLKMLDIANKQGIKTIILTPHYHKGRMDKSVDILKERFEIIKENNKTGIKLYLGSELFSDIDLVDELNNGQALTINNTKYVLVEFYPNTPYKEIENQFKDLLMNGYKPIIAHVERYTCFLKDPYLVEELSNLGVLIQINAGSLKHFNTKMFINKLLKYEMVDVVGSDAHNITDRSPEIASYIKYIERKVDKEYANRILRDNAIRILEGD